MFDVLSGLLAAAVVPAAVAPFISNAFWSS